VSVCPARALTFERVDQETSLLVYRYIIRFILSSSSPYIKAIGPRSRSCDL